MNQVLVSGFEPEFPPARFVQPLAMVVTEWKNAGYHYDDCQVEERHRSEKN